MQHATIWSHGEEGMPVRFDRVHDGWIRHVLPCDATHAPPSRTGIPLLDGAVAIAAAIAARSEHFAGRQRNAGVIPTTIGHRLRWNPFIRAPVEQTGQCRGSI